MALTNDVLRAFSRLDTRKQVETLRRVGLETAAADRVLGHLAGNAPERYRALVLAIGRDEGMPAAMQAAVMEGLR